MAEKYYNNAVNDSLDTVGNWWLNETFDDPAGSKPGIGDNGYIRGNVASGSITCDFVFMGQSITITGGTFTAAIYALTSGIGTIAVQGGTFNGNIDTTGADWQFQGAPGATINGNVLLQGDSGTNTVAFLYGGTFNGDVTVLQWGRIAVSNDVDDDIFIINGRIRWGAGSYYTLESAIDFPAEADVRDGVDYDDGNLTGTLGGGTITITVT